MADITLTIPNNKLATMILAIKRRYPNVEKNSDGSAKYTDNQWAKEVGRRFYLDMYYQYEVEIAAQAAASAVVRDEGNVT